MARALPQETHEIVIYVVPQIKLSEKHEIFIHAIL
jgi:hypothetical protein